MSLEEIASYCEFLDCEVSIGDPDVGFIRVDGSGVSRRFNNYRRFLAHNELSGLPKPRKVLSQATVFRILRDGEQMRELSREEFEGELEAFQRKVGSR
ncbi:MAG TPA: hypothetical protein VMN76_01610 [Acidobacteriota bacterium]|nr:hypothetical protein [Acidobacteriota bacterium]